MFPVGSACVTRSFRQGLHGLGRPTLHRNTALTAILQPAGHTHQRARPRALL